MIDGEVSGGRAVSVIHENRDDVRDVAVLDAVVNNGDRKGPTSSATASAPSGVSTTG